MDGRIPSLVVLVSGNGSNLQAILDAIADGRLRAEVVAVVSNRANAYGLVRADEADISTVYHPLKPYRETDAEDFRAAYEEDLARLVSTFEPDLIVCAGWMHVLGPAFLDVFPGRVINLHPALPGELPGTDAIARAWAEARAGLRTQTGVMVHHVIPEVDAGPVVALATVPILADDTVESLAARVHETEHKLLVDAIAAVLDQHPSIDGDT